MKRTCEEELKKIKHKVEEQNIKEVEQASFSAYVKIELLKYEPFKQSKSTLRSLLSGYR